MYSCRFGVLSTLGVLSGVAATLAHAQDTRGAGAAEPVAEVVVEGRRLAQQRSIELKRAEQRLVDAVSADEIGRLAERNLAEALDGLAGVSLTADQGEGRFVAIRGVNSSLNNFTVNGISVGTPEVEGGGRRVPLNAIGSELLETVEVVKVQTPDMDGQGVGGTVNLITASPFDHERQPHTLMSLEAGHDDLNGERPYAGELKLARVDTTGTWGWLLGAAHSFRRAEARGIYQGDWDVARTADGASAVLPENTKNSLYEVDRRRTGVNATLEWRPSGSDRYFLRGFFSRLEENEVRHRFMYFFRNNPQSLMPTTGTSSGNHREQDLRIENKEKHFANIAIGGDNELGGVWRLDYVAQLNDNEQNVPSRNWEWRGLDASTDQWTVDSSGLVDVIAATSDPHDPARLAFLRLRARDNVTQERASITGFNLRRSLRHEDAYLKFGARYTRTERDNDATQMTYAPGTIDWTLSEFGHYGGVFRVDVDGRPLSTILVDPAAADVFFAANARGGDYFDLREEQSFAAQLQNDYAVDERVLAGYAMASLGVGRWNVIAGARVERTDVRAAGFALNIEDAAATRKTNEGNSSSVLPSVVARFDVTDDVVLRAAWSNTLGRPSYERLAPSSLLEREGSAGFLQIGNPDLEPRESTNYDVAIEWYFGHGGLLAGGAFHKQIDNEIVSRFRAFEDFVFDGETFEQFTQYEVYGRTWYVGFTARL